MAFFDFLFRRPAAGAKFAPGRPDRAVHDIETLDKTISVIQKNPYMKYAYDLELLKSIEKFQEQIAVNQQLILDSVTVKDPRKGEIGLSEWLHSEEFIEGLREKGFKAQRAAQMEYTAIQQRQPEAEMHGQEQLASISGQISELKKGLSKLEAKMQEKLEGMAGIEGEKSELEELKRRTREIEEKGEGIEELREKVKRLEDRGEKPAEKEEMQEAKKEAEEKIIAKKQEKQVSKKQKPLKKEEIMPEKPLEGTETPEALAMEKIEKQAQRQQKSLFDELFSAGVKNMPSIFKVTDLVKRKPKFESFTEGDFYFEYPEWDKDATVSEDVIMSVSAPPFGVELSMKRLYPLTFGGYVIKIISLIRTQLHADVTTQKISTNSAYMEFEFRQKNTLWLYKAKVVECNDAFYTVAVKGPKNEFSKIEGIADYVIKSVRCLK